MRHAAALALTAALAAAPAAAGAEQAGACHCYQDRTFDPERPAAADPYILATARSTLVSAAFGVAKRDLVGAVMTGAAADDLLLAHWAGARLGQPAELAALRAAGAATNEAILAVALAKRIGTTPAGVAAPVRAGRSSWGALLRAFGLEAKGVDGLVRQAIGG